MRSVLEAQNPQHPRWVEYVNLPCPTSIPMLRVVGDLASGGDTRKRENECSPGVSEDGWTKNLNLFGADYLLGKKRMFNSGQHIISQICRSKMVKNKLQQFQGSTFWVSLWEGIPAGRWGVKHVPAANYQSTWQNTAVEVPCLMTRSCFELLFFFLTEGAPLSWFSFLQETLFPPPPEKKAKLLILPTLCQVFVFSVFLFERDFLDWTGRCDALFPRVVEEFAIRSFARTGAVGPWVVWAVLKRSRDEEVEKKTSGNITS